MGVLNSNLCVYCMSRLVETQEASIHGILPSDRFHKGFSLEEVRSALESTK